MKGYELTVSFATAAFVSKSEDMMCMTPPIVPIFSSNALPLIMIGPWFAMMTSVLTDSYYMTSPRSSRLAYGLANDWNKYLPI